MSVEKDDLERGNPESEGDPGAAGELEDLRQQLASLQEQAEQNRNDYMRAVAEMDNTRKRAQREGLLPSKPVAPPWWNATRAGSPSKRDHAANSARTATTWSGCS